MRVTASFVKSLDAHKEVCCDWHAVSITFLSLLYSQTALKSMYWILEECNFVHCRNRKANPLLQRAEINSPRSILTFMQFYRSHPYVHTMKGGNERGLRL